MALRKRFQAHRFDFDVNIVPIVDCLTILIIFMLASGVYVSIGMLEVSVSESSDAAIAPSKSAPPQMAISLALRTDHSMEIAVGATKKIAIGATGNSWDLKKLGRELASVQAAYGDVKSLTVEPEAEVPYQDVVLAMEAARKTHPDVLLGGF